MVSPMSPSWWVWAVVLFILLGQECRNPKALTLITKIALDKLRPLGTNSTVKAVYGTFKSLNPVWVQLWEPTVDDPNTFVLVWQQKLLPIYGNGTSETINLEEDDYVELKENYRMGMINEETPGPVEGAYQFGRGVVLSDLDRDKMSFPLIQGAEYSFDELLLPYHIPLFFCNVSGCPTFKVDAPTIPPQTAVPRPSRDRTTINVTPVSGELTEAEEFLQSVQMVVGLLVWNIALTLFVFVIILVLICVCADIEKLKRRYKRSRRTTFTEYTGNGASYHQNVGTVETVRSGGSSETRDGWKTAGSWKTPSMPRHDDRTQLTEDEFNA